MMVVEFSAAFFLALFFVSTSCVHEDDMKNLFDCVDVNKQPSLDHPLLKGHKIQMKPTWTPGDVSAQSKLSAIKLGKVSCAEGTVPIRRAKYIVDSSITLEKLSAQYRAKIFSNKTGIKYHGAQAYMNVINPKVSMIQNSFGLIWIQDEVDPVKANNFIAAGWAAAPSIYGNHRTYLVTYWKDDHHEKGCFNLNCPGFIQVDREYPIDTTLLNISTFEGVQQELQLRIIQDRITNNWWVTSPRINVNYGYWPGSWFSRLANGAATVSFGGLTQALPTKLSPPMGFGTFPQRNYTTCAYFAEMKTFDRHSISYGLVDGWVEYTDNAKCYGIKHFGYENTSGYLIEYGGPGGFC